MREAITISENLTTVFSMAHSLSLLCFQVPQRAPPSTWATPLLRMARRSLAARKLLDPPAQRKRLGDMVMSELLVAATVPFALSVAAGICLDRADCRSCRDMRVHMMSILWIMQQNLCLFQCQPGLFAC